MNQNERTLTISNRGLVFLPLSSSSTRIIEQKGLASSSATTAGGTCPSSDFFPAFLTPLLADAIDFVDNFFDATAFVFVVVAFFDATALNVVFMIVQERYYVTMHHQLLGHPLPSLMHFHLMYSTR